MVYTRKTNHVETANSRLLQQYQGGREKLMQAGPQVLALTFGAAELLAQSPFEVPPQAYWKMASINAGEVADSSGNGNVLTVANSSIVSGGIIANSLRCLSRSTFGGGSPASATASGSGLLTGSTYTVSMWARVLYVNTGSFAQYFYMRLNNAFANGSPSSSPTAYDVSGTGLVHGDLHHFLFRPRGTGGINPVDVSIDGGAWLLNAAAGAGSSGQLLRLLHSGDIYNNQNMDAELSEVAIWDVRLTDGQCDEVYQRGLDGQGLT